MAAKLKEFSIFNVSIEFGFMNSKIIDQHFCRDALSISRHVGRRVFFCCCLKYFLTCPTSQIDGVAQNLCVFLGSRPNIFESFVTSPMFAVRSCYKSILSIAILFHPLCQILKIQCSKQRHYYLDGNDCYHQMVFLSWSVVLNTEERPSRQKLLS